ncbi:MAG: hypothetical protein OXC56_03365 [Chloroflexi bacterium]|nr:hypothetical protein [Chloroflexota bacterium]
MGISVGRFAIVEGDVREHGPWLVEQTRDGDPRVVQLIVLVEPVDERSAEFCEDVAGAVADLFVSEELSLTGGLVRAIRRAHANLAEWNRRSLREHRVAVGVTCVVLREGEATIAQAGPGLVYLVSSDGTRRVTTAGEPAASPLGSDGEITPQFVAAQTADTSILLLSSFAETSAGPSAIGRAFTSPSDRLLTELFVQVRDVPDVHAVFITDAPDEQFAEPVEDEEGERAEPRDPGPFEGSPQAAPPLPIDDSPDVRVTVVPTSEREETQPRRRMPTLRRARVAGTSRPLPWRWLAVGLLAVAAVVAAIILVPPLLEEDAAERLDARLAEAGELLTSAGEASDIGEQRDQLNAALTQLEEARSLDATDPRIGSLQRVIQDRLDEVNGVIEVEQIETVLRFEGVVTRPLSPEALAFGANRLWVMDTALGRVLAIDPRGIFGVEEVYRAGRSYGLVEAATPVGMAWDPLGGRLLVLDQERSLFSLSLDAGPARLPLRAADELSTVDAIAVHAGSLYLLDAGGGEVWRYLPAGGGFDSERTGLLGVASLSGGRALHIADDVFVLDEEELRRFQESREDSGQLQGIDRPLNAPVGLVADVDVLYIADRGGRRIVVGDPTGPFLRQYTYPDFTDLRGIALGPDGELYVLTGFGILSFEPAP